MDLKILKFQNLSLKNEKEFQEFIENLKDVYENYWKSNNEINTSIKLTLTVSIDNNDNLKISKFEEALSNGDLIYDFYIFKINNKSNVYKIIFNGSPDHFLKIMKDKKLLQIVNLSPSESWIEKIVDIHPMRQIVYASILQVVVFFFMLFMFKVIGEVV